MPSVANLLLRVSGDNKDAKRALREVSEEIIKLNSQEAKAEVEAGGVEVAKAKLQELENALTIIGQRNVTAKVQVDVDSARARLQLLRRELTHAAAGGAGARNVGDILEDIAEVGGAMARLGAEAGTLGARVGGFFANIGASTSQMVGSLGTVGPMMIQMAVVAALLTVGIAVLGAALLAVVGVLGALAASLAAALAAMGAFLVAGLFALIPVLAVAVFAFARVAGAVKALKEEEEGRKQQAEQLRAAEQRHSDALRARGDAVRNLAVQTAAAYRAQRQATIDLRDAELSLQSARLGVVDADLRLERAKLTLKELKEEAEGAGPAFASLFRDLERVDYNPEDVEGLLTKVGALPGGTDAQLRMKEAIQDVARATLGVKEAKQGEVRATERLSEAQRVNNEFARDGIRAYAPYVAATRQLSDANRQLAEATAAVATQREAASEKTRQYSRQELGIARQLLRLWGDFKRLMQSFTPPIFAGISDFIETLSILLRDGAIQSALNDIGEAIGYVIRVFSRTLRMREVRGTFASLARSAAGMVRSLGRSVFRDFFLIMLRIARHAAPGLLRLFRRFEQFMRRLRRGTEDSGRFGRRIRSLVRSFNDWLEVGKQLTRVVLNFIRAAKDDGDSLARTIARILRRWADFLGSEEGREAVKQFLRDSVDIAKDLWSLFKDIVGFMKDMMSVYNELKGIVTAPGKGVNWLDDKIAEGLDSVFGGGKKMWGGDRAWGGMVPGGGGFGDNVLMGLEGGEYVVRRSVVAAVGRPFFERINAGMPPVMAGAGGRGGMNIEKVILPPPPAAAVPDARYQAVQFARELSRRGG